MGTVGGFEWVGRLCGSRVASAVRAAVDRMVGDTWWATRGELGYAVGKMEGERILKHFTQRCAGILYRGASRSELLAAMRTGWSVFDQRCGLPIPVV